MARPHTLIVVRTLLLANGVLLAAIGALFIIFGTGPARLVVGAVIWLAAAALFTGIRWTDPYTRDFTP